VQFPKRQGFICDCSDDQLCTSGRKATQTTWEVDPDIAEVFEGATSASPLYYCHDEAIGAVEPVHGLESFDGLEAVYLQAVTRGRAL
jgi:hypothetical protein